MAVAGAKTGAVRFYENPLPAIGDCVWAKVLNVDDTSATIQLLEYANHEGMIPYTEFTRLRIRSIGKVIKVGRQQAVQVLRVDNAKGYIDLSKKQVTRREARACEERFVKAKEVHSIVCHAADATGIPRMDAVRMVAWPLYRTWGDDAPEPSALAAAAAGRTPSAQPLVSQSSLFTCRAHDAFVVALRDPERVFGPLNLPADFREKLMEGIEHRLRLRPVKLQLDMDVTCFTSEGIAAIIASLIEARAAGDGLEPAIPVSVSVISAPRYALRCHTEHREEGMARLRLGAERVKAAITARGGAMTVTVDARVVGNDWEDEKGAGGEEESGAAVGGQSGAEEDEESDESGSENETKAAPAPVAPPVAARKTS